MTPQKLLYEQRIQQLETELQNARTTIEQFKKEQDEFIAIACHDLEAPLRKLSTFIERFIAKYKKTKPDDDTVIYIDRIQSTLADMRSMINDLSDLFECTHSYSNFKECNLNEILQIVLKEMQPVIKKSNVKIIYSKLPTVQANSVQLKNLFQNLITNAIKFRKKDSSLQIQISASQMNEEDHQTFNFIKNGIYFKIEIIDNGIGFEEQYSEKIFQPFIKLHGKSAYEGNGFGLAKCKKIAEKHEGFIMAKPVKDGGARFILILPETHK